MRRKMGLWSQAPILLGCLRLGAGGAVVQEHVQIAAGICEVMIQNESLLRCYWFVLCVHQANVDGMWWEEIREDGTYVKSSVDGSLVDSSPSTSSASSSSSLSGSTRSKVTLRPEGLLACDDDLGMGFVCSGGTTILAGLGS